MDDPEREAEIDDFDAQGLANVDRLEAAVKAAGIKLTFDNSDELRTEVRRLASEMRKRNRSDAAPVEPEIPSQTDRIQAPKPERPDYAKRLIEHVTRMTEAERIAAADRLEGEETEKIDKLVRATKEGGVRLSIDGSEQFKAEIKRIAGVIRTGNTG